MIGKRKQISNAIQAASAIAVVLGMDGYFIEVQKLIINNSGLVCGLLASLGLTTHHYCGTADKRVEEKQPAKEIEIIEDEEPISNELVESFNDFQEELTILEDVEIHND